jgi:hypothetical protein
MKRLFRVVLALGLVFGSVSSGSAMQPADREATRNLIREAVADGLEAGNAAGYIADSVDVYEILNAGRTWADEHKYFVGAGIGAAITMAASWTWQNADWLLSLADSYCDGLGFGVMMIGCGAALIWRHFAGKKIDGAKPEGWEYYEMYAAY